MDMNDEDIAVIEKYMDWEYYPDDHLMIGVDDGDIIGWSWPSLDAIHEIEMSLTDKQMGDYLMRMYVEYKEDAIVTDSDQRLKHLLPILKN